MNDNISRHALMLVILVIVLLSFCFCRMVDSAILSSSSSPPSSFSSSSSDPHFSYSDPTDADNDSSTSRDNSSGIVGGDQRWQDRHLYIYESKNTSNDNDYSPPNPAPDPIRTTSTSALTSMSTYKTLDGNAKVVVRLQSQESEANALCAFRCGISNWPGTSTSLTGWGCTCSPTAGIATNAPCGTGTGTLTVTAWTGVSCSGGGTSGSVSQLSLVLSLVGTISPSIGDLMNLQLLDLSRNSLSSSIPSQISKLTNLQRMDLYKNSLTGSIPSQISVLTNLQIPYLYSNRLTSSIPSQISVLTNLQLLSLSLNRLSGSIPSQIAALTNLGTLDLSDNSLTGLIPSQLMNLKNLNLPSNRLTGPFGVPLCSYPGMNLDLQTNDLSCIASCVPLVAGNYHYDPDTPVTDTCGLDESYLSQLNTLCALKQELGEGGNSNDFVPSSGWECMNYVNKSGSSTSTTTSTAFVATTTPCAVPGTSNVVTSWTGVGVSCSGIGGTITSLDLSTFNLKGKIPSSIFSLTGLTSLDLSINSFSGSIPKEISLLSKLTSLNLQVNNLEGSISREDVCNQNIQVLYLQGNNFKCIDDCVLTDVSVVSYDEDTATVSSFCDQIFTLNNYHTTGIIIIVVSAVYTSVLISAVLYTKPLYLILVILPFIDVLTDFLYIISADFFTDFIFCICVFFYLVPNALFLYDMLYIEELSPRAPCYKFPMVSNGGSDGDSGDDGRICWLTSDGGSLPLVNGKRPRFISDKVDDFFKVIILVVTWVVLVVLQLLTFAAYFLWILMLDPALILWTMVGMFLYQTKILAFVPIWNLWISRWTGKEIREGGGADGGEVVRGSNSDSNINPSSSPPSSSTPISSFEGKSEKEGKKMDQVENNNHMKTGLVDLTMLNKSLFHEFVFETSPQIIIQLVNGKLLQNFNTIGYVSIAVSILFAIDGLYVFFYYLVYKGMALENVPTLIEVPFKDRAAATSASDKTKNKNKNINNNKRAGKGLDVEDSSMNGRQVTRSSDGFEMSSTETKNPMSIYQGNASRSIKAKDRIADTSDVYTDKFTILEELGSLKERVRLLESNLSP